VGQRSLGSRLGAFGQRLTERVAALPPRRQERLWDAGLAVAIAAVNAVSLLPYHRQLHPLWVPLLLVIAQGIPLAWRRSATIGAALVIAVARVSYDQLGYAFAPFPLGPAIAFYTIIDRRGPVWRWTACGLVAIGIAISETSPGHTQPYESIFQALIFVSVWAAAMFSRARRASLEAAQSRAEAAESERDQQVSQAAARERARIARELHDIVAHHVSLMAVQAEAAASLLPGRPADARRSVDVIGETARQALTELRRLLGVLRGPAERAQTTPQASLGDLEGVLEQVRGAGLAVSFDVVGTPFPLAPGIELTAHRIIQEALTNTLRHAPASQAAVVLSYEPGYVTVGVADSGPTAPAAQAAQAANGQPALTSRAAVPGTGLGLAGIAERVASCGGSLTVGPTEPGGFSVTARLPAR
jgi:signal transduction histidine kinase